MRIPDKLQTLTTGDLDQNGNVIPPDTIEWYDYDKNPVLLYDKNYEGHGGVVVGKVIDRKRVGNGFVGKLAFMERYVDADIAYEKYTQGVLRFVSIGGYAAGNVEEDVFISKRYRPREFSLVKHPANLKCDQIDVSKIEASEREIIKGMTEDGMEVRYLTMSANLICNEMPKQNEPVVPVNSSATEPTPPAANQPAEPVVPVNASATEPTPPAANQPAEPVVPVNASATNQPNWHQRAASTNMKPVTPIEFKKINCDEDFNRRLGALNAAFRMGAKKADQNPENVETVRVLSASMLDDPNMVILASRTNITDSVTQKRTNALQMLVECAAGGAAASTLAAADLGVIKYLSLFYHQLFANDTFRRSVRFVPMSDREGAIYVESGIEAPTYVGNVTPINAPRYFYDDIKRTIARRVFAFTPITFQHADMAILAYDKQSTGLTDQMARVMQDISTYWLSVIGNTPNIERAGTTGTVINTTGMFPIEAPNSNVNIHTINLRDIVNWEGIFLMQNFRLENKRVEVVLPSRLYTSLAGDEELRSNLTMENDSNLGSHINFSASRITPRNPVVRFNTQSNLPELDPSMYADNNVADDGTFTPITPATTTADHIGAGVAFLENEVLAGVGAIELISMPDPFNYGTTISGWVSTGATVARSNGVGAALIAPTLE